MNGPGVSRIAGITIMVAIGALACTPQQQTPSAIANPEGSSWIDVTATLDPATTPIYEGDAPMKFEFLKDMRKGDPLTINRRGA